MDFTKFHRRSVLSRVVNILGAISTTALLALMLITTLDVFGRSFSSPIVGSDEISSLMLLFSVVLAIPRAAMNNQLVSVDFVTNRLKPKVRAFLSVTVQALSLAMLALLCFELFKHFLGMFEMNATTPILRLPISWCILLTSFSFFLLTIIYINKIVRAVTDIDASTERVIALLIAACILILLTWLAFKGRAFFGRQDPLFMGSMALVALFAVFLIQMPIFLGLTLIGFVGICFLRGPNAGLNLVGTLPYSLLTEYHFSVIPLFILMGEFCFYSKLGQDLYLLAYRWMGSMRGGLAIATIGACGGFSSVCGDSLATAVTMGTIALPEMKRYNYDDGLAIGSVAAGGTLGVLLPPSLAFILYSLLTSVSLADLFIAGILPGLLLIFLFCVTIYLRVLLRPELAPPAPKSTFEEKMAAFKPIWAVIVLVVVVIGGMYSGVFTPTEGGAMGAFFAMVIGIVRRRLTPKLIWKSVLEAGRISAVCLSILMGASIFGYFLAATKLPIVLASFVAALPIPSVLILITILIIYLLLGTIMPAIPMLVLTVPIFFPVVTRLGFDPVWFGVMIVLEFEMAVITPPMGINVLAMKSVVPDVPVEKGFIGIIPFVLAIIVCVALLIIFPDIALFLPEALRS